MADRLKKLVALTCVGVAFAGVLCSPAKADEALVLKYSGGRLVFAGIASNLQFSPGQGFLNVDSQAFGFLDKCSGLFVRVLDDVVIKQSRGPLDCNDLPRVQ